MGKSCSPVDSGLVMPSPSSGTTEMNGPAQERCTPGTSRSPRSPGSTLRRPRESRSRRPARTSPCGSIDLIGDEHRPHYPLLPDAPAAANGLLATGAGVGGRTGGDRGGRAHTRGRTDVARADVAAPPFPPFPPPFRPYAMLGGVAHVSSRGSRCCCCSRSLCRAVERAGRQQRGNDRCRASSRRASGDSSRTSLPRSPLGYHPGTKDRRKTAAWSTSRAIRGRDLHVLHGPRRSGELG